MAATLPWRRDEEPAQLPRLAPHSGGVGPKDHARGFYLRSHRIRPISTINAIRAIIVDLERHRVVDLLPERSAATLTDWLRQQPGIEVVARDRSTEYASGTASGAPAAVQVADRWHLLANMRQAVERWFAGARGRLQRLSGVQSTH